MSNPDAGVLVIEVGASCVLQEFYWHRLFGALAAADDQIRSFDPGGDPERVGGALRTAVDAAVRRSDEYASTGQGPRRVDGDALAKALGLSSSRALGRSKRVDVFVSVSRADSSWRLVATRTTDAGAETAQEASELVDPTDEVLGLALQRGLVWAWAEAAE